MTECFLALLAETVRRSCAPVYVATLGQVELDDLLDCTPGRIVRVYDPLALQDRTDRRRG